MIWAIISWYGGHRKRSAEHSTHHMGPIMEIQSQNKTKQQIVHFPTTNAQRKPIYIYIKDRLTDKSLGCACIVCVWFAMGPEMASSDKWEFLDCYRSRGSIPVCVWSALLWEKPWITNCMCTGYNSMFHAHRIASYPDRKTMKLLIDPLTWKWKSGSPNFISFFVDIDLISMMSRLYLTNCHHCPLPVFSRIDKTGGFPKLEMKLK